MRQTGSNISRELPQTAGQKVASQIDLEPTKLKTMGGRFLYYPSQILPDITQVVTPKSTDEYIQSNHTGLLMNKPEYQKEEIILDKTTNTWKIVKEQELYKFSS